MKLPGFVGGSNVLSSTLEDCERSLNMFPEVKVGGHPKVDDGSMRDRPGLRWLFTVGSDDVECLFHLDGRAFGVAGTTFFEFFDSDTYTVRGTVANDGIDLATMCSGGSAASPSMLIISGSTGYTFELTTNTFATITDPDFPTNPVMCEFFAGYFLVLDRNTRAVSWSNLEDPSTWDTLDIIETSWAGDNISFIKRLGTHIWTVGTQTSQVLYATGGVDVFAPAQESLIEHGCVGRFTGQRTARGVVCLDQGERGVGQVVLFQGLQPQEISTYSINLEQITGGQGLLNASYGVTLEMQGHDWYYLNNRNPENNFRFTPVYDFTEGLWHHWTHWNSTTCRYYPFVGQSHCTAFERHYIGDSRTGAVYDFSFANLTDTLA